MHVQSMQHWAWKHSEEPTVAKKTRIHSMQKNAQIITSSSSMVKVRPTAIVSLCCSKWLPTKEYHTGNTYNLNVDIVNFNHWNQNTNHSLIN